MGVQSAQEPGLGYTLGGIQGDSDGEGASVRSGGGSGHLIPNACAITRSGDLSGRGSGELPQLGHPPSCGYK